MKNKDNGRGKKLIHQTVFHCLLPAQHPGRHSKLTIIECSINLSINSKGGRRQGELSDHGGPLS